MYSLLVLVTIIQKTSFLYCNTKTDQACTSWNPNYGTSCTLHSICDQRDGIYIVCSRAKTDIIIVLFSRPSVVGWVGRSCDQRNGRGHWMCWLDMLTDQRLELSTILKVKVRCQELGFCKATIKVLIKHIWKYLLVKKFNPN